MRSPRALSRRRRTPSSRCGSFSGTPIVPPRKVAARGPRVNLFLLMERGDGREVARGSRALRGAVPRSLRVGRSVRLAE
jgi:hypothetical protein